MDFITLTFGNLMLFGGFMMIVYAPFLAFLREKKLGYLAITLLFAPMYFFIIFINIKNAFTYSSFILLPHIFLIIITLMDIHLNKARGVKKLTQYALIFLKPVKNFFDNLGSLIGNILAIILIIIIVLFLIFLLIKLVKFFWYL